MSPWLFDQFMDNILSNYSEGGKGEFSGRSAVGSKYKVHFVMFADGLVVVAEN